MSYPFGITGIGYNPYMNTLGLGGVGDYSSYGSYYNPTMMGMGSMGMGSMGMMGMWNPAFMGQMNQAYQNIEKSQLKHNSAMHNLMLQNKTEAMDNHTRAMFEQSMIDGDIKSQINLLHEKIVKGEQDQICEEYDKLKQIIYTKYADYFKENSNKMDIVNSVNRLISNLYTAQISPIVNEQVDLMNDIKKYGETAFMHGFNKEFLGKTDYHDKYTEETLSYLYGTSIDNKAGKDRIEKIGGYVGKGAEGVAAGLAGYGAAVVGAGLLKAINPFNTCKNLTMSGVHKFGKWAALAAIAGDIIWQMSRD